jgi:predicted RNase H-like nuclease
MITCIGIDLAWSPRNLSGGAVIRGDATGGVLAQTDLLGDDQQIVDYIERHTGVGPVIVAVDAPLRVPNETGRRPCEAEIGRVFGRYQAGAHPANRRRLAFGGVVRGEALVAALERLAFTYVSAVAAGAAVRQIVEVFPHPAMIGLFNLQRTLKYKAKPNRSFDERLSEWGRYQAYISDLATADPPLHGQETFMAREVAGLTGRRLKAYEDQVDALLCAYIALYAFRWGKARCRVFGTLEEGSIFTPVPEEMLLQL